MIVTVTERAQFKRCRWQWDFASRQRGGLESALPRTEFLLGTLIHLALEQWLLRPDESLPQLFSEIGKPALEQIVQRYERLVGASPSEEELKRADEAYVLGVAMCVNYQTKYGTPIPKGWKLVAPEQKIEMPIPGTEHLYCPEHKEDFPPETDVVDVGGTHIACNLTSKPHFLEATMDAVIQNPKGYLFVLEHKTWDKHPNVHIDIQMNDQFLAYQWVLTKLDMGPVGGVCYDGLWKRGAIPKGKKFDDLFLRMMTFRPPQALEAFEAQLVMEVNDMAHAVQNGLIYNNRRFDCNRCEFERLCEAKMNGDDMDAVKQAYYTART